MNRTKFFGIFATITSLLACSHSTSTVVPKAPEKEQTKEVSKPKQAEVSWSIDVPGDWTKATSGMPTRLNEVKKVLVASKTYKAGAASYDVTTTVVLGKIPNNFVENFPEGILSLESERDNTKILDAREVKLGSVTGVQWIEAKHVDPKTMLAVIGTAGAKGDIGIVVYCGGNAKGAALFLKDCIAIADSLKLN
jgi:hypothetical protein